jgi:hypothetical protein
VFFFLLLYFIPLSNCLITFQTIYMTWRDAITQMFYCCFFEEMKIIFFSGLVKYLAHVTFNVMIFFFFFQKLNSNALFLYLNIPGPKSFLRSSSDLILLKIFADFVWKIFKDFLLKSFLLKVFQRSALIYFKIFS